LDCRITNLAAPGAGCRRRAVRRPSASGGEALARRLDPVKVKVDLDAIHKDTGNPGGFNSRANRNNPLALSEHSFGFAVDFKASLNPNIGKNGALDAVADATGVDPRKATSGGKTAFGLRDVATSQYDASAAYVRIMGDADLFTARIRQIVDGVRIQEKQPALDDAAARGLSESLRTGGKTPPAEGAILAAAFPAGAATSARKSAVASLLRLARARRAANPAKGGHPGATSRASTGSVAAHGFLNLPPLAVAALAGSDSGCRDVDHDPSLDRLTRQLETRPM
jgi:hypothetical protein